MTVRQSEEELAARLAAERLGVPFLVYRDGEDRQHLFAMEPERRSVTIGRRGEADISLPWDRECSRLHAELELRAGEWTISDDGISQNGTQQRFLRALCRPLFGDGEGIAAASDEAIAKETGIALDAVTTELDHLTKALGLHDMPGERQRSEVALALRSGPVEADDGA
jgi:hypothetical protein